MDLKISTPKEQRVWAYYDRNFNGGITTSVYGDDKKGHPICSVGYLDGRMVLIVNKANLNKENIELIMKEE